LGINKIQELIKYLSFILFALLNANMIQGQQINLRTYQIPRINQEINVDGELDSVWSRIPVASQFYQVFPLDYKASNFRTDVRMMFDAKNIYVSAVCHNLKPEKNFIVSSLRRDFSYPRNDAFGIYLCPLNDKTNGFSFAVSPLGVQREGILTNGGNQGVTTAWDNKWFSEVKRYQDSYVVEMAIPFKTIRYNEKVLEWGLNFSRQDLNYNENSVWNPMPRSFNIATLAQAGVLKWEVPPPKAGPNISLIPYVALNKYIDHTNHYSDYQKPNIGGDAKVGITSALNLDVTINPDFSTADVDDQVINLDRFEIFYPEKRQFFIENSDLFGSFGFTKIRPFFSRRIGLNSQNKLVPILGGVRLSGKLNAKDRIGVMNMQTSADTFSHLERGINGINYSTIAFQHQIGKASNISFIGINKQTTGNYTEKGSPYHFNRLLGFDYNYARGDNKYVGKVFLHQSFSPAKNNEAYAHASFLNYNTPKLTWQWNHEFVGLNYNPEVGYLQRKGYWRLEPDIQYNWYPKSKFLYFYGFDGYTSYYTNIHFKNTDILNRISFESQSKKYHTLTIGINKQYLFLLREFNPSSVNSDVYKAGSSYNFFYESMSYTSDYRKKFYLEYNNQIGAYYDGKISGHSISLTYRLQPFANFSIKYDRTYIKLPNSENTLQIISPKVDLSFTRKLFLTTYMQINTQRQNTLLNIKFQYRFKPMSDIFIVYSRNFSSIGSVYYQPESGKPFSYLLPNNNGYAPITQSLIIKAVWWLNI